jgi:3-methylfumaryl-CoA hydratase
MEVRLLEEQTIVCRELLAEPECRPECGRAGRRGWARKYDVDTTALFRWSALPLNGHRIHGGEEYCRPMKGYADLVILIHGPLIMSLVLDFCVKAERPLGRFTYRALSPLFLPHPFTVDGEANGGSN